MVSFEQMPVYRKAEKTAQKNLFCSTIHIGTAVKMTLVMSYSLFLARSFCSYAPSERTLNFSTPI